MQALCMELRDRRANGRLGEPSLPAPTERRPPSETCGSDRCSYLHGGGFASEGEVEAAATDLRGALPPVDLRAVCFVRAMVGETSGPERASRRL